MKIVVLDAGTLGFDDAAWAPLRELGDVRLYDKTAYDAGTMASRLAGAEAVFTNKVPIGAEVLREAPELRFIGVLATGYNVIAVEEAARLGKTVCNVPAYSTESTAQHAVALALELCNRVGRHAELVREGAWIRSEHFSFWETAPRELASMTAGVVGYGAIGRRVAGILRALGARVLVSRRRPPEGAEAEDEVEWTDNATLFAESDLVTLHCPQTEATENLVDAAMLRTMRRGALLVNAARGGLVDEHALAEALREGRLAGAAVDVVRTEPMAADCPLRDAPNCWVTPHMAWAGEPARRRLLAISADNLRRFLEGHPVNVVDG